MVELQTDESCEGVWKMSDQTDTNITFPPPTNKHIGAFGNRKWSILELETRHARENKQMSKTKASEPKGKVLRKRTRGDKRADEQGDGSNRVRKKQN
eukprot:3881849-Pleurochrysis_carterae.AAC.1